MDILSNLKLIGEKNAWRETIIHALQFTPEKGINLLKVTKLLYLVLLYLNEKKKKEMKVKGVEEITG